MGCIKFENSESNVKGIAPEFETIIKRIKDKYDDGNFKNAESSKVKKLIESNSKMLIAGLKNTGKYELKYIKEWTDVKKAVDDLFVKSKEFNSLNNEFLSKEIKNEIHRQIDSEIEGIRKVNNKTDIDFLYTNKKSFDQVYESDTTIYKYMEGRIKDLIIQHVIFDDTNMRIIKDDLQLNQSIGSLKDKLYRYVRDLIKLETGESQQTMLSMYEDGQLNTRRLLTVMNKAEPLYNNIQINRLKSEYINNQFSSNLLNNTLLNGHMAYTLLKGDTFDKVLKNILGKSFTINKKFKTYNNMTDIKYLFDGVSELRKSWNDSENSDSSKSIGKIPNLLITRTPLVDSYTGNQKGGETLTTSMFLSSINKLKNPKITMNLIPSDLEFTARTNPTEYFAAALRAAISLRYHKGNNEYGLIKSDFNVYRSIYDRFYNPNVKNSLINMVRSDQSTESAITTYNLLNSISGLFDRSMPTTYAQYTQNKGKQVVVRKVNNKTFNAEKARVNNNIQSIPRQLALNPETVLDKYSVRIANGILGEMEFSIPYTHEGRNEIAKIRYNLSRKTKSKLEFVDGALYTSTGKKLYSKFNDIKDVESSKITEAVLNGNLENIHNDDNSLYLNMVRFVSDVLNIDMLSPTYANHLSAIEGLTYNHFLKTHLMGLANSVLFKAETNRLFEQYKYNNRNNPEVITSIKDFVLNESLFEPSYFRSAFNDGKLPPNMVFDSDMNELVVPSSNDLATIEFIAEANEIVANRTSKSTVKNAEGNSIPTNRIASHVGNFFHTLVSRTKGQSPNRSNLFASNTEIFKNTIIKSDSNINGRVKQVKNYSTGELIHTDFVLGFLSMLMSSDKAPLNSDINPGGKSSVLIQPVVVSDKTYYVNLLLDATSDIKLNNPFTNKEFSFNLKDASIKDLKLAVQSTVGETYHNIAENVLKDYRIIFSETVNGDVLSSKSLVKAEIELNTLNEAVRDVSKDNLIIKKPNHLLKEDGVNYDIIKISQFTKELSSNLINKYAGKIENGDLLIPSELSSEFVDAIKSDLISRRDSINKDIAKLNHVLDVAKFNFNEYLVNQKPLQKQLEEINNDLKIYSKTSELTGIDKDIELDKLAAKYLIDGYSLDDSFSYALDKTTRALEKFDNPHVVYDSYHDFLRLSDFDLLLKYTSQFDLNNAINKNSDSDLSIADGLHITKANGKLRANNPLIYYTEKLYNKKSGENNPELTKYFKNEESKLIYDFLDNGIKLFISDKNGLKNKALEWAANNILKDDKLNWVDQKTNSFIIAKDQKGNPIKNKFQFEEATSFEINPLLSKYLYTYYLVSKNYRNLMLGTELNYSYRTNDPIPTLSEVELQISQQDIAQTKRSIGISSPTNYMTQGDIMGIPSEYRLAIVRDEVGTVFNHTGLVEDGLEVNDGSAKVNGFVHYLENFSLQDLKTGKTKKSFSFNTDSKYGVGQLLKFATFPITNELMLESIGSTNSLHEAYKRYNSFSWTEMMNTGKMKSYNRLINSEKASKLQDYKIDLTKNLHGKDVRLSDLLGNTEAYKHKKIKYEVVESKDIGNNQVEATVSIIETKGGVELARTTKVYTKDQLRSLKTTRSRFVKILDLIKADRILENPNTQHLQSHLEASKEMASIKGESDDSSTWYYMLVNPVDDNGSVIGPNTNFYELVKLDSHYDIHQAFGGVHSYTKVDGGLVQGDLSIYMSALYANNVGMYHGEYDSHTNAEGKVITSDIASEMLSQHNTFQPLKDPSTFIAYEVMESAMKIGRVNVNDTEVLRTDNSKPIKTMTISTDGLGIQQDTDSVVLERSTITEFSQVMQAAAAKGYSPFKARSLYRTLANIAKNESKDLIDAIVDITRARSRSDHDSTKVRKAKTKLAVMTMRELLRSIDNGDLNYGVQKGIMSLVKDSYTKVLQNNDFYDSIDFKMPVSDPSVYRKISIDFVNAINRTAIKRKHPGDGFTLAPSYNVLELYRVPYDLLRIKTEDVLNQPHDYDTQLKYSDIAESLSNMTYGMLDSFYKRLKLTNSREYTTYFKNKFNEFLLPDGTLDTKRFMSAETSVEDGMILYQSMYNLRHEEAFAKGHKNIDKLLPETAIKLVPTEVKEVIEAGAIDADWMRRNTKLNHIDGYYDIKINTLDKYYTIKDNFKMFIPDIRTPMNLRPELHVFKDSNGRTWNTFDLYQIRNSFKYRKAAKDLINTINNVINHKNANDISLKLVNDFKSYASKLGYDISRLDNYRGLKDLSSLISDIEIIVTNESERAISQIKEGKFKARLNDVELTGIEKGSYKAYSAEAIMPFLFKEKFGISNEESLAKIKKIGFSAEYAKRIQEGINNSDYDLALLNPNHNNLYIKFDEQGNKSINLEKYRQVEISNENVSKIDDVIYLLDKDGNELFQIAHIENGDVVRDVTVYEANNEGSLYVVNSLEGLKSLIESKSAYASFDLNNTDSVSTILEYVKNSDINDRNVARIKELLGDIDLSKADKTELLKSLNKSAYDDLYDDTNKKYTSFIKSLDLISARIPGQTMQSFMKMKVAAFTRSTETNIYVSRWQSWLQGSDYDIDTAWIMASEIDDSGIYIGWSPYFSLDSVEILRASEKLLSPTGLKYRFLKQTDSPQVKNKATDVTENVESLSKLYRNRFDSEEAMVDFIKEFNTLLYTIDTSDEVLMVNKNKLSEEAIKFADDDFLLMLNRHSLYLNSKYRDPQIPTLSHDLAAKAYRNIVSSMIMNIVQDPANVVQAHIPINMDDPKRSAANSPLGIKAARVNLNTPTSISSLQSENADGVQGISISAVGVKNFLTLTSYYNEILLNGSKEDIKNLLIFKNYKSLASPYDDTGIRLSLANVNWKNISDANIKIWSDLVNQKLSGEVSKDDLVSSIRQQLKVGQDQALIISALLSAATDNAKELILSKLGAGPKTMGIYLYLSLMGYEFDSVAKFMTSDTVQDIISLSKTNSFENDYKDTSITKVIRDLENGPSISDFLSSQDVSKMLADGKRAFGHKNNSVSGFDKVMTEIYKDTENYNTEKLIRDRVLSNFENALDRHKVGLNRFVDQFILYKNIHSKMDKDIIKDFKQINQDSTSTILLGQALGINQGIKTKVSDRLAFSESFNNHFLRTVPVRNKSRSDIARLIRKQKPLVVGKSNPTEADITAEVNRLTDLVIDNRLHENFSFFEFINKDNTDYSNAVIEIYNLFKPGFNLFDLINKTPHVKASFDIMWAIHEKNLLESYKYRMTFDIVNKISENNIKKSEKFGNLEYLPRITEREVSKIESYVDDKIIFDWLISRNDKFTMNGGHKFMTNSFDEVEIELGQTLEFDLSTENGISNFKKWVEDYVVPELKQGLVDNTEAYTLREDGGIDGNIVNKTIPHVKSNPFVRDILMTQVLNFDTRVHQPQLRLPIEMGSLNSDFDTTMFQNYQDGLKKLGNYRKGGMNLVDMFFLYNLVVNKNKYGSDTLTSLFADFDMNPNSLMYKYESYLGDNDNSGISPIVDKDMGKIYIRIAEVAKNYFDTQKEAYIEYDRELGRNVIKSNGIDVDVLNGTNLPDANRALKLKHSPLGLITDVRSSLDLNIKSSATDISKALNTLYLDNQIVIKYNC